MHTVVALVAVAILGGACYAVSPLGNGQHHWDAFSSLASIIDYAPTPTPTPTPRPTATPLPAPTQPPLPPNPGGNVVVADIEAVFGPYSWSALAIARCESGYYPYAYNPTPVGWSHAEGVFQILYPSTWDTTPYSGYSPYNYDANIHAAYDIFVRDGYSWREWQCQP